PFQFIQYVYVRATCVMVNHDKYGETDGNFRRGNGHYKEDEHLSCSSAMPCREGDHEQVHRIEHELNAHENDDGIPAIENAENTDDEKRCTKPDVVVQRNLLDHLTNRIIHLSTVLRSR